jgi:hypothetical protein
MLNNMPLVIINVESDKICAADDTHDEMHTGHDDDPFHSHDLTYSFTIVILDQFTSHLKFTKSR